MNMSLSRPVNKPELPDFSNTEGARLVDCPIKVLNNWLVIKPVPKMKTDRIILSDEAQIHQNAGVVVGCGGDVPNAKSLVGKTVIYAKFQHYEPYSFRDKNDKVHSYIILDYKGVIGELIE